VRPPLVVGNWKMNPASIAGAVSLARAVRGLGLPIEVGVAPPSIALAAVAEQLRGSPITVYAQDVHWEEAGAYTGGLAAPMLAGIAAGSIVGHSEVRRDQGDDDERVGRKLARALAAGLRVVLCVGESEAEHVAGETHAVVERQLRAALGVARPPRGAGIVVAYEPVWAIGTGRPASGGHASAAAATVRRALAAAGLDGEATRVLYGGSVSAGSVAEFAAAEGIDGALVGGASLKPEEFGAIVRAFAR